MGVHTTETFAPLVFIEIPAIVSGSTQGAGLGSRYFKHLERAKILIFVLEGGVDKAPEDYINDFNIVQGELENYGLALSGKSRLVALNKVDIFPDGTGPEAARAAIETAFGVRAFWISSEKGTGLESMMEAVEALYGTNGDV
jgi:GTP-binding protein